MLIKHFAGCGACADVLCDVMLVEGPGSEGGAAAARERVRWVLSRAAFLALPVLLAAVTAWRLAGPVQPAVAARFEARLSGAAEGLSASASGGLLLQATTQVSPRFLRDAGVRAAGAGDWEAAALAWSAARESPRDSDLQVDAAAVHFEVARATGRAEHLVRALGAATRAASLDSRSLPATFNKALALQRLGLEREALTLWQTYVRQDASSPWGVEAARRAGALQTKLGAPTWPDIQRVLRVSVEPSGAAAAARDYTSETRGFLESDLLPRWAAAAAAGEAAGPEFEAVRTVAGALAEAGGDRLYVDTVRAIERAGAPGSARLLAMARAHLSHAKAATLLAADQFGAADPFLRAAEQDAALSGSPYTIRIRLDLASVARYRGTLEESSELLDGVLADARNRSYRSVESRAHWLRGLLAYSASQFLDALSEWESMLSVAEALGDAQEGMAAHGLLANLWDHLASEDEAWRHRQAYLPLLSVHSADRIRFGLLASAAGHALESDAAAALTLQNLVVEEAARSGRIGTMIEATAQRGLIRATLGQGVPAAADLEFARQALRTVADPVVRQRIELTVSLSVARTASVLRWSSAAAVAEQSIQQHRDLNETPALPELHLLLSKARMRDGDVNAGNVAQQGLSLLGSDGTSTAAPVRKALAGVAMRAAMLRGDVAAAYRLAQVARGADPLSAGGVEGVEDTQARLHRGEALLGLNQLDDELVVWLVTRERLHFHVWPLTGNEARRLVLRQLDEVGLRLARPVAAAELYRLMIRPVRSALVGIDRLLVAPDSPYHGAAFAGLFDRERGRFLVEDSELAVAPAGIAGPSVGVASRHVVVPSDATASQAVETMRRAGPFSDISVSAMVAPNGAAPDLSLLRFATAAGPRLRPDRLLLARDIPSLPRVRTVLVSRLDSHDPTQDDGGTQAARLFLRAGAAFVVSPVRGGRFDLEYEQIARIVGESRSVLAGVTRYQRDEVRRHRALGTWSLIAVHASG